MRRWRFEALLAALAAGILGFANIARAEGEYVWTVTGADYNATMSPCNSVVCESNMPAEVK